MMKNLYHIFILLTLAGLLILLSDPFMLFMPPLVALCVMASLAVLMAAWAGFVLKEDAVDEREIEHRLTAGRVGYLSGLASLTIAVLVQGFTAHHVDPWIALTLILMVTAKIITRLVLERRH